MASIDYPDYRHIVIPTTSYRPDRKHVSEEEGEPPHNDDGDHNVHDLRKAARLEKALVEQEDRDFYAGNGDNVEELECKVHL